MPTKKGIKKKKKWKERKKEKSGVERIKKTKNKNEKLLKNSIPNVDLQRTKGKYFNILFFNI
jgi:hypothetical protein